MAEESEYRIYGYRWLVLIAYGLVLAVQAFLWLSFSPIETDVQKLLGIGSTLARLLALVGPFMFILIASPAGSLADRRGFKFSAAVGVVMLVVAGVVKAVVPHVISNVTVQYWIFLAMQVLGGTGSVFALVNMSKMPIKWFPERQRALATGLTTMSMYLGTAIGLPLTTAIANIPENANEAVIRAGLNRVLLVYAVIMGAVAVLYFLLVREEPPTPAGPIPEAEQISFKESFPRFMRSPAFRALCFVSLLGYGIYISLTVTMEKIMGFHGFEKGFASLVAGGVTLGGIVGAAFLPGFSEKVGLRRPFLILAALVNVPALLLLGLVGNKPLDMVSGIIGGFFLLPALPITFTIAGEMEEIGPRLAGTAVGILLAVGSIGSVAVPLLMEVFARKVPGTELIDYRWSIVMLAALAVIGVIVILLRVKETGPEGRGAGSEQSMG